MTASLVERARDFAHRAHDSVGHKRKYSGAPYWVHTDEVADLVALHGGTARMVAAAHLHDVLEDVSGIRDPAAPFGMDEMIAAFGRDVFMLVFHLTDLYTAENHPGFNREKRKALERARINFIPLEAKAIKLADLISNSRDIVKADPNFAKVYMREKSELLKALADGNKVLLAIAEDIVSIYYRGVFEKRIDGLGSYDNREY